VKKDKEEVIGYPDWAQKSWWIAPDTSVLKEYLEILIGIKRNVPNINARIHEVSTIVAQWYLSGLIFSGGKIIKENVNPNPRKGPDIEVEGITSNRRSCKCRAEVVTNFSFKHGPEADKLYNDVKKLVNSKADKKFLVVLFEELIEEAKKRCKNRSKNPVDLHKHGIQVLSIEKIINYGKV
jgi:hypothetical protein